MSDEAYRCPSCGYTAEDAAFHMDHRLCEIKTGLPNPRKVEAERMQQQANERER